jgi:hypothetical protein
MKKRPTDTDTSAPEKGNSNPSSRFLGTHNPRHLRVLAVLLVRRLFREELDKIAGCSNGPELVAECAAVGWKFPVSLSRAWTRTASPADRGSIA